MSDSSLPPLTGTAKNLLISTFENGGAVPDSLPGVEAEEFDRALNELIRFNPPLVKVIAYFDSQENLHRREEITDAGRALVEQTYNQKDQEARRQAEDEARRKQGERRSEKNAWCIALVSILFSIFCVFLGAILQHEQEAFEWLWELFP